MAVAGRHLLAEQDQQVVPGQTGPVRVRRVRVVLRGVDEVQARRPRQLRDLREGVAAVGVLGVEVAVAPVPGAAPPPGPLRRVHGPRDRVLLAVGQGDRDLVRQPLRRHRVRAERDVPGARPHRPRDVARGGVVRADEELGARPARPAPEAPATQVGAALVEEADVERVALGAGRDGGAVVGVGDVDLAHAPGDFDREIHEVGGAGRQGAAHGSGAPFPGCRRGEAHASQGKRGGGSRHEHRAPADSGGVVPVVVLAHAAAPSVVSDMTSVVRGWCVQPSY